MFDAIVDRYDLLNDLLSFGLDRWWRRAAARSVPSRPGPGGRVLDLGCGTGKLGALLADRLRVVGIDVNHAMLSAGRREVRRRGGTTMSVQGSAFHLPFRDGTFDSAASAFVLRNLDDLPGAFSELHRVLVPGATIALVDITEPPGRLVRAAFDAYLSTAAPALGALVGRREPYRYLVRSLRHLPEAPALCRQLGEAGFIDCRARRLTGGTATLFTATKRDG